MVYISEAAAYIQDIVLANWRFRVGREFPEVIESVSGISLTWKEIDEYWRFVLSVRRDSGWIKVEESIKVPKDFDFGNQDEVDELYVTIQETAFLMLHNMKKVVFPDVKDYEDD